MSTALFELDQIHFSYRLQQQKVEALRGFCLQIKKGEFTCLSGPSGSGKTTLLNLMGLIEVPTQGVMRFTGVNVASLREKEKTRIRLNRIGFIFQNFNLIPTLSAAENVEYFLIRQKLPSLERKERVKNSLKIVGLFDQIHKRPGQMSGGQRQRVAIARALAKKPDVILADEPTASLDQTTGKSIMEILLKLSREQGMTVLISSHDPMVMEMAPRNIRMKDGQVIEA